MKHTPLFLAALLVFSAPIATAASTEVTTVKPPPSASEVSATKLAQVISGDWREQKNQARDAYRHPKETLEFFGIESGQTVVEITPGGGWYTEILAPLLRDGGTYVGAMVDPASSKDAKRSEFYQWQWDELGKKLAADPTHYDQVKLVKVDPMAPVLGEPGSADRVLTFRNVHNWTTEGSAQPMFNAFFAVLKPGGVLGVVEHRAPVRQRGKKGDAKPSDGSNGYVDPRSVLAYATNAGFVLEATSEINANPKDTHDHPQGVWTLPPTLRLKDKDREKYEKIGESDRMTLRFVKPATK